MTDKQIDLVWSVVDYLMTKERFDLLDEAIESKFLGRTDEYSTDLHLSILSSTLPVKNELEHRGQYVVEVEETLEKRGEDIESLLLGLR